MVRPQPPLPAAGRNWSRPGSRRRGRECGGGAGATIVLCCCYVAAAGGRFAAAFTGVSQPPLVPSAYGEWTPSYTHQQRHRSLSSRTGGFPAAAEAASASSSSRRCPDGDGGHSSGRNTCGSSRSSRKNSNTALWSSRSEPRYAADTTMAMDAEFSDIPAARDSFSVSAADEAEAQARGGRARGAPGVGGRGGGGGSRGGGGRGSGGSGKLPLPFFDVESVGLRGRWEEMGGNFLLRPPNGERPKALVHFLGGAFVGAAPHLTYNYLLSGLAELGFLVVATPYPLGFDYLNVCDGILDRFEQAAVPLAAQYGALPVVGIGHSCGALLQLLITCLFPDTPRAANALISFNNKPVSEAVPGFEELVLPLVMQVLKEGGGKSTLFSTLEMLRETVDNLVDGVAASRFAPAVLENEVVPLVRQVLQITDQLPALFQSIADGTREFTPTPEETRDVVSKMYRARRTIMIRFENDSIDESEGMKDVIQEGKTLLRMRRPLVDMELRYEIIKGNHITPLTQNVFLDTPVDSIDPLLGVRQGMKKEFLKTVNQLGQILVDWLEESAPPVPPPPSSSASATSAAAASAAVGLPPPTASGRGR